MSLTVAAATGGAIVSLFAGYAMGLAKRPRQPDLSAALLSHESRIAGAETLCASSEQLVRELRKQVFRDQERTAALEVKHGSVARELAAIGFEHRRQRDNFNLQGEKFAALLDQRFAAHEEERQEAARQVEAQFKQQNARIGALERGDAGVARSLEDLDERFTELTARQQEVDGRLTEALLAVGQMVDGLDGKLLEMQEFIVRAAADSEARRAAVAPPVVAPSTPASPAAAPPVVPPSLGALMAQQQQLQRVFAARRGVAGSGDVAAGPAFPEGL